MRFAWHIHHDVLIEALIGPISGRADYIKKEKPKSEQALHLKLLKVVQGNLPKEYVEAGEAYARALEAYDKAGEAYARALEAYEARKAYARALEAYEARKAYDKARKAYAEAREAYENDINALHAKECPNCPWDGTTIFTAPRL